MQCDNLINVTRLEEQFQYLPRHLSIRITDQAGRCYRCNSLVYYLFTHSDKKVLTASQKCSGLSKKGVCPALLMITISFLSAVTPE